MYNYSTPAKQDFAVYYVQGLFKKSLSKPGKSYVGLTTKPLNVRLREHNDGLSKYTKTFRPWEVIYHENFHCRFCAESREKFLKSGFGFRLRKILLENFG